jgi:hypothetical protein
MFVRSVVDRACDTHERRAEEAVKIAAEIVGGLDVMDRWTATDQVRFTLLAEVIEAAARTPLAPVAIGICLRGRRNATASS